MIKVKQKEFLIMPVVNNVSVSDFSAKTKNMNNNIVQTHAFLSNPLADAFVWGGIGAAAGAGYGLYSQHKLLKDKTRVDSAIEGITSQIEAYKKCSKNTRKLEYSLKCLKNNKINLNSVKNWAIAIGIVALVPQLICNTLMWAGKKGYDKITGAEDN